MRYILSADEMKAYDRDTSERIGIPSMVLMERAALVVADALEDVFGGGELRRKRALVMAGMGNNGGDGLAVGRLLAFKGVEVTFYMVGNPEKITEETKSQRRILENLGFSIQSKLEPTEYDMVVDALFGTGLSRAVTGEYLSFIEEINRLGCGGAYVCAVDIPSGICADTGRVLGAAVKADLTVTFAFAKRGHLLYPGRDYVGKLTVKDIGITEKSFGMKKPGAFCYERKDVGLLLPKRRPDGNKGTFGKVLLVAGSYGMSGACVLCGKGILRAGAGMVKILTPSCNREIVQSSFPEAMLCNYDGRPNREIIREAMGWADTIVVGPGLGTGEDACLLMEYVLEDGEHPVVVDADGLNLISKYEHLKKMAAARIPEKFIITPHPGELLRLLGADKEEYQRDREGLIRQVVRELNCTVAAKDAVTLVAQSGRNEIYINTSGNDGMATAGSGDVLAGVIGGLWAQGMDSFGAACLGVYLHGLAGEAASIRHGHFGAIASDIIEGLSSVMEVVCEK